MYNLRYSWFNTASHCLFIYCLPFFSLRMSIKSVWPTEWKGIGTKYTVKRSDSYLLQYNLAEKNDPSGNMFWVLE